MDLREHPTAGRDMGRVSHGVPLMRVVLRTREATILPAIAEPRGGLPALSVGDSLPGGVRLIAEELVDRHG